MSAVAQESTACVCGFDHLCECGCGETIHPLVRRTHELLAAGAKVMTVSRLLGIDKSQVYVYRTKPPRFLKGHYARALERNMVRCANPRCDRTFNKRGPNHLYCTSSSQRPDDEIRAECGRLAYAAKWKVWDAHDAEVERRATERAEPIRRRKSIERLLARETPAEWIAQQSAVSDEALAALVAEQAKDDQWGHHVWTGGVRLDRRFVGGWGEEIYELHNYIGDVYLAHPETYDPADICIEKETEERLRSLTGHMETEDVMRMNSDSLFWLQERLRDEGLVPRGSQKVERDRLRDPTRHTGSRYEKAPTLVCRKTRKERIEHKAANRARGNSNRPDQKPRKRWTRDSDGE